MYMSEEFSRSLDYAAILIWLPQGQRCRAISFDLTTAKPPPVPNPHVCWTLGEALWLATNNIDSTHKKLPWIKVGKRILAPDRIERCPTRYFTADFDE
jgi:hypothetical protein